MKVRTQVWMTAVMGCVAAWMGAALHAQTLLPPSPATDLPQPPKAEALPEPAPRKESLEALLRSDPMLSKELETVIESYIKRREEAKKQADAEKKASEEVKKLAEEMMKIDRLHQHPAGPHDQHLNLPILYDNMHPYPEPGKKSKAWYERMSIRGYTQFRFDRTLDTDPGSAEPNLFGDRGINGTAEDFFIRRCRFIFSGDLNDHLFFYIQPDFASTPQGSTTSTFFSQLRDAYADVYIDKDKVNRFRVGLSKIPYGWENMQSSINRITLDRTDALNTAVAPNERDLGVIYYWTPVAKQELLKALVDGGLKGSNNFGIFALGAYNGQGGSVPEANLNLYTVARFTWPVQLGWSNGQVIEASIQGIRGDYVVSGSQIRALGRGNAITPAGTGGVRGILEERVVATFVVFPQPFGFQTEWQTGEGPGLNDAQTAVIRRHLNGGYVMGMYKHDTDHHGIFIPYTRYQQFTGGYRNIANAPFGHQRQVDFGVEWQIRKEMELTVEYSLVNTPNFTALNVANTRSYTDFEGSVFRVQFQINY